MPSTFRLSFLFFLFPLGNVWLRILISLVLKNVDYVFGLYKGIGYSNLDLCNVFGSCF